MKGGATVLAGVLLLTGCSAEVTSRVPLATSAAEVVSVTFTGAAAEALTPGSQASGQLAEVVLERTGSSATFTRSAEKVSAQVSASPEKLTDLTGVASVVRSSSPAETQLRMELTSPTSLVAAIRAAAQSSPQPQAAAAGMLAATSVVVVVVSDGQLDVSLDGPGQVVMSPSGREVTVTRLATDAPAVLTVSSSSSSLWKWLLLLAGAVVVLVVVSRKWSRT